MVWDERLRFNASAPPADGLERMARALTGGRAEVVEVRRLTGGVDAATHAVHLDPGGWFVVKRVRGPNAGALVDEHDRLRFAAQAPVATPEPVAVDAAGTWFGHPALAMGLVPGGGRAPGGTGPWIESLARALVAVHATPLGPDLPAALRAPHAGMAWEAPPPAELPRTPRVQALVEAGLSVREAGGSADVLLHHDFHHGNVLWHGDRVTGVVDWNEARLGPAVCDVAYCSVDLAMTRGLGAADRFTGAYTALGGGDLDGLARWHCLWTANAMRWIGHWIAGFHEAGIDLPLPVARRRLVELADRTLAEL